MTLVADEDNLLADTGPFCRCAEAGEYHLDAAAEYLRPNVRIVEEVRRELRDRAKEAKHQRLERLKLLDVPEGDAITITDAAVLAERELILGRRRKRKPAHENADKGELTTVLAAEALAWPVLVDDGWGKRLATHRRLRVYTTQDLAVEMAATGHMKPIHALGIYRIVYKGSTQKEFEAAVAALKAQLV